MNAVESRTHSKASTENQELSNIKGENEMNAAVTGSQNTIATVYQNVLNLKEEIEMKTSLEIKNATNWLSQNLSVKSSSKILGGLVVGALLMTATALPLSPIYADGPNRPLTAERVENPPWIAGDDRSPQYFYEGTTQVQAPWPEVKTELDPEALDDLIRYAFPSDLDQGDIGNSAVERVVNPAWIAADDRNPQYFYEGKTQDNAQVPEVMTELDPEAMDDLIRYAFPSDLEQGAIGTNNSLPPRAASGRQGIPGRGCKSRGFVHWVADAVSALQKQRGMDPPGLCLWTEGLQGSAITDGGWGPGFEDPFYSQHFFKMNKEPDADKRMAMTEEYFDHVRDVMLQLCVIETPIHPMYNAAKVAEWSMHPSLNGNIGGASSFETVVLK